MKVLHFVSTLSRGSGVMSVIMNYYRHIDRTAVQFDFLCFIPCEDSHAKEIERLGGKITYIPRPGLSPSSLKALNGFLAEHGKEYSWLHNHEVYLSFLLEPLARHHGISGFIMHSHTTKYSDRPLSALRNRVLCLPIRFMKSDRTMRVERFACSEAAGEFLYGKQRMEKGEVFILHNAIDCEKYRFNPGVRERVRKELGLEGKFVIGHVGRFVRQKNHEFLVRVFAECRKQRDDCVLLLVGDGPLRAKVERQVKELGLSGSVVFLGQRDDVAELYQGMDVFVLPSLYEGLPVSCLEAQVCGLPCIVSDTITKEIFHPLLVTLLSLKSEERHWSETCLAGKRVINSFPTLLTPFSDIRGEARRLTLFYET